MKCSNLKNSTNAPIYFRIYHEMNFVLPTKKTHTGLSFIAPVKS